MSKLKSNRRWYSLLRLGHSKLRSNSDLKQDSTPIFTSIVKVNNCLDQPELIHNKEPISTSQSHNFPNESNIIKSSDTEDWPKSPRTEEFIGASHSTPRHTTIIKSRKSLFSLSNKESIRTSSQLMDATNIMSITTEPPAELNEYDSISIESANIETYQAYTATAYKGESCNSSPKLVQIEEQIQDPHQHEMNGDEIYRTEMLDLVDKHKLMVTKQRQEIEQLKNLLKEERKLNRFLITSPRQAPPRQAPPPSPPMKSISPNVSKSYRKRFIPMEITSDIREVEPCDPDPINLREFNLLPTLQASVDRKILAGPDSVETINLYCSEDKHIYQDFFQPHNRIISGESRNVSNPSTTSSVMSTSHEREIARFHKVPNEEINDLIISYDCDDDDFTINSEDFCFVSSTLTTPEMKLEFNFKNDFII